MRRDGLVQSSGVGYQPVVEAMHRPKASVLTESTALGVGDDAAVGDTADSPSAEEETRQDEFIPR